MFETRKYMSLIYLQVSCKHDSQFQSSSCIYIPSSGLIHDTHLTNEMVPEPFQSPHINQVKEFLNIIDYSVERVSVKHVRSLGSSYQ